MNRRNLARLVAAIALLSSGCDESPRASERKNPPIEGANGSETETERVEESEVPRDLRRVDLDQLQKSFADVAGDAWTTVNGANLLAQVAATLGVPDYASSTVEDLSHGPLFDRYLNDAAKVACAEMVRREPALPAEERVLGRYANLQTNTISAEDKEKTLRELALRFHGRELDAQALARWNWLYDEASRTYQGNLTKTHRTVCIALFSHPDFYTY